MNMVRKVLESMYDDSCSVVELKKQKISGVMSTTEETVLEDQPCKLSFSSAGPAGQTDAASSVRQETKLFIAPEIEIKSGSRIDVTHCGKVVRYGFSGIPAVYETHQEIPLDLFQRWA